jgi:uncharacterized membrane-anchored protein YitT (DUF2179 family)
MVLQFGNAMRNLRSAISIVVGILLAGLGLEGFLLPNHFIDGGVTGISMLIAELTFIPLPMLLLIVNAPFLVIGYQHIGKAFTIKSSLAIIALAICLAVIPYPVVTSDKLLGATFGGFFVGAGIGLAIRGGGVLDGTEILAVILSKRTFATVGEVILVLNVFIFAVAAMVMGIEPALYSMLTYFAASKTVEYLLHGIEAYNGVLIFSAHHELIRQAILSDLKRGVTAFKATGGYTATDQAVLFCLVTRLECTKLEALVKAKDNHAFVVTFPVHDAVGGVVKHPEFH